MNSFDSKAMWPIWTKFGVMSKGPQADVLTFLKELIFRGEEEGGVIYSRFSSRPFDRF